ncbi:MAG: DUF465 domain-containing protein [Proteobacteria bacterium]|nr:DUF465 domain-containing protein [Pseudomonadota bacterium]
MTVEHHALINDLPEYKDAIHTLKVSDARFARMMDDYHKLTREVERIENAGNSVSDEIENALKSRRVKLKDELMQMLVAQKGKCSQDCGCS